jgi:hypothetical protein
VRAVQVASNINAASWRCLRSTGANQIVTVAGKYGGVCFGRKADRCSTSHLRGASPPSDDQVTTSMKKPDHLSPRCSR